MRIEVLGMGCPKCMTLEENVRKALTELSVPAEILKVTDLDAILKRGVMSTPALVIDGKVAFQGKNPTVAQIKQIIQGA